MGAMICRPTGRPSSGASPHGTDMAALPREVGRDRAEVGKVHRERISDTRPDLERGRRRCRRDEDVDGAERRIEIAADQGAHLLRLTVVGLVVAAGQGVGAEDDAPLHLVAAASRVSDTTSSALRVPSSPTRRPYRIASKRARLLEHSDGAIR